MKIKTISILILCIIALTTNAQDEESKFHPIVLKAKETSLYTDRIDWETVNTKFNELSHEKNTAEELQEALQYLINSLGDKHAQIRFGEDYALLVTYTGKIEAREREFDSEFHSTVINDISAQFSYALLDNNVGYLKVVAIGQGIVKEQADQIRNGLKQLKAQGAERWIVDLRYNGGGNMEPMISGLAPLIGEGHIGGAVNNNSEISRTYKIENSQFDNYGRIACEMDSLPSIAPEEKVAVLLSQYTVSSGEMLAVCFKGRANTIFIGEETGGYTTGNGFDAIGEGIYLIISQDVFMDRNGNGYYNSVGVDFQSEFKESCSMDDDEQIDLALEWLLK